MADSSVNNAGSPAVQSPAAAEFNASKNPGLLDWGPLGEYFVDSVQHTILFWDVLRQRSEQYYAQ
jgi:hypothetical protein